MATASSDFGRRGFVLKPLHIIGIAIIALAIGLGYYGLQSALRPYHHQRRRGDRQRARRALAGYLVPGEQGHYDAQSNFTFQMQDNTGKVVQVVHPKAAGQLRAGDQHRGDRPLRYV
ncbi:MAG: hypothetical protein U0Z44_19200 [Kouleothrix sp.]